MNKIKKLFRRIWAIFAGVTVLAGTSWAIFKQIMKNKANKEEIINLRKGLNDVAEANDKVLRETIESIKISEKIMAKTEAKISTMTLKEKVALAKKLGY